MFSELKEVLEGADLSFTMSLKGDKISVSIIPKSKDKEGESLSNVPLLITGTAEELEEKFVSTIAETLGESVPFLTNAADFKTAAKKQYEDSTKEKTAPKDKQGNKTGSEPVAAKPAVLTADQKKIAVKAKDAVEKARKSKDNEMVNFLKKQTVAEYTKAKFDQESIDAITAEFETISFDEAGKPVATKTTTGKTPTGKAKKADEKKDELFPEAPVTDTDTDNAGESEEPAEEESTEEAEDTSGTGTEGGESTDDDDIF